MPAHLTPSDQHSTLRAADLGFTTVLPQEVLHMAKKKKKKRNKAKQKAARKARAKGRQFRKAVQYGEDGTRTEAFITQDKGYKVEMIRDFLDHLLLELRAQHYENLQVLKRLQTATDAKEASDFVVPEKGTERLEIYQEKYQSALIAVNEIDKEGATEEEVKEVVKTIIQGNANRRDEQIGHLEALKDLFEEALLCARVPFGVTEDGEVLQPAQTWKVTDFLEEGPEESPEEGEE